MNDIKYFLVKLESKSNGVETKRAFIAPDSTQSKSKAEAQWKGWKATEAKEITAKQYADQRAFEQDMNQTVWP